MSDNKCPGRGRNEIHKMCPAHGTAFYMSGYEFTEKIEQAIEHIRDTCMLDDIDIVLLNTLKKHSKE